MNSRSLNNSHNTFNCNNSKSQNDDVDDMTFLSHPQQGSSGYMFGHDDWNASSNDEWLRKRQQLMEKRRQVEERTLESSKVSMGLLWESEKVGVSTAEDLVHQREQLQKTEERLDTINSTMRATQKHLNSMKSVFSGIKGYFSKNKDSPNEINPSNLRLPSNSSSSGLKKALDELQNESNAQQKSGNHPSLRNRGIEPNNPFDDEADNPKIDSHSAFIDKQLDENLVEMNSGLSRLKNLAIGLGTEIDEHNELLDKITTKAERSGDTIQYQNRQMKNLLK